jgi:ABC-type phosphate/phosphonate transport system substrate-binding protein
MKTRKITLLVIALALLALMATACNKTDSSANANVNSSPGKNSSSPSGTSSTVSKRFVGTWVEEGEKSDQGSKFTEDGKIIELSSNKTVGTYTTSGDDKATINIAEGGSGTATLESDTRMKMVVGGETAYLTKK